MRQPAPVSPKTIRVKSPLIETRYLPGDGKVTVCSSVPRSLPLFAEFPTSSHSIR